MKTKHTKGRWQVMSDRGETWISNGSYSIATIDSQIKSSEQEANANLIAAAPELFEALVEINRQLDEIGMGNPKMQRVVDSAIKKATL